MIMEQTTNELLHRVSAQRLQNPMHPVTSVVNSEQRTPLVQSANSKLIMDELRQHLSKQSGCNKDNKWLRYQNLNTNLKNETLSIPQQEEIKSLGSNTRFENLTGRVVEIISIEHFTQLPCNWL